MRRLTLFIYSAVVMLVGGLMIGAAPSAAQIAVSLPDVTARAGGSDTIPITVGDLTGENVIAYQFTISFDESVVELTGVTVEGTLSAGNTPEVNTDTPGEIGVAFATTTPLSGSGTLIRLNATYGSGGTSALTFDDFQFNEGDPADATSDGSVTLVERAISVPATVTGNVGDEIEIAVTVDELTAADDVISFEFDATYDPTVLTITGATTSGTLSEGFNPLTNELAPGQVRVVAAGTTPIVGEGTLIILTADLIGEGTTALSLSNVVFNEGTPVLGGIGGIVTVVSVGVGVFEANLSGVNENPAVETVASGTINVTLDGRELVLTGAFGSLSANYTASHIHLAAVGVNGGVIIGLNPTLGVDNRSGEYVAANNTFDLDAVTYPAGTTADSFIEALNEGRTYVNVHTTAYTGGEVRGQLLPADNEAPDASSITAPDNGQVIVITGDPADVGMAVGISAATDPDGNAIAYVYQLAADAGFSNVVYSETVLEPTGVELTIDDLADIHDEIEGEVVLGNQLTVYHRVITTDGSLWTAGASSSVVLERQSPTDIDDPIGVPDAFLLRGNYPNPFNPSTTVSFDLPEAAHVSIRVIDLMGREVMSVPAKAMQPGTNRMLEVDAASLASGTYIYRIVARGATSTMVDTGTMTLVK